MSNENQQNEILPNVEQPLKAEAPVVENADAKTLRLRGEAAETVAKFDNECNADLQYVVTSGESAEVPVDPEDMAALQALPHEAEAAKQKLLAILGGTDAPYQLTAVDRAQINSEAAAERIALAKESIARFEAQIRELDREIEESKSSLLKRIIKFRSIARLERQKNSKQQGISVEKRFLDEDQALKQRYDSILEVEAERERVTREEERLRKEAEQQRITLEQSEREDRDIKTLSKEFNCFFVHDIVVAEWKPSANNEAVDTTQLTWNDQLDILHGLEPTISASTLKVGSAQGTFAHNGGWGVFLRGGEALGGGAGDIGSVARGLRERDINTAHKGTEAVRRGIRERGDSPSSHNEVIISRPEVAAVYLRVALKDLPPMSDDRQIRLTDEFESDGTPKKIFQTMRERFRQVTKRGITPFILTENNEAFIAQIEDSSDENFTIVLAEAPVDPQTMMNMPGVYQVDNGAEARRKSVYRVLDKVQYIIPDNEKESYTKTQ